MHRLYCVSCMMRDIVRQITYVKYMRGLGYLLIVLGGVSIIDGNVAGPGDS